MSTTTLFSNHFLARCEKLSQLFPFDVTEEGVFLARGFADLGYELFLSLPNGKLSSLFTGAVSEFSEEAREHFFRVLLVDELLNFLAEQGKAVQSLDHLSTSGALSVCFEDGETSQLHADTVHEALVEVAIKIVDN